MKELICKDNLKNIFYINNYILFINYFNLYK